MNLFRSEIIFPVGSYLQSYKWFFFTPRSIIFICSKRKYHTIWIFFFMLRSWMNSFHEGNLKMFHWNEPTKMVTSGKNVHAGCNWNKIFKLHSIILPSNYFLKIVILLNYISSIIILFSQIDQHFIISSNYFCITIN